MKKAILGSVALCVFAAIMLATSVLGSDLDGRVEGEVPALFEIFKQLHANPELSYQEVDTANYVAKELRRLGTATPPSPLATWGW